MNRASPAQPPGRWSTFPSLMFPGAFDRSPSDPSATRQPFSAGLPSSRAFAQPRFQAPDSSAGPQAAGTERMRLDARTLQQRSVSADLTIRTRDGDVVTLRIREQSESARQVQERATTEQGEERTRVNGQAATASTQVQALEALFDREGVSDLRYGQAWSEGSAESGNLQYSGEDGQVQAQFESQRYRAGTLEFEVEGTLDAEELAAVGELIGGVNALAQTFFDGDMKRAFDQALELGYDAGEIAGYSLELRDRQLTVAEQRYRAVEAMQEPDLPRGLFRPIGNYAQELKSLFELDQVALKGQLFDQLMKQIDAWRQEDESGQAKVDSFSEFNRELLALTDALGLRV